jgi:hypothetical protein
MMYESVEPIQPKMGVGRRALLIGGGTLLVIASLILFKRSADPSGLGDGSHITLPYPKSAALDTLSICNYSGEDVWYSTGIRPPSRLPHIKLTKVLNISPPGPATSEPSLAFPPSQSPCVASTISDQCLNAARCNLQPQSRGRIRRGRTAWESRC